MSKDQKDNTYDYQQSISFLPLYLDEDYSFRRNRSKYLESRKSSTLGGVVDGLNRTAPDSNQIAPQDIDDAIKLYDAVGKF